MAQVDLTGAFVLQILHPFRVLALFVSVSLASTSAAQVFPTPSGTDVIDDAALIPPEAEAALALRLDALEVETGAQMMVVTLVNTTLYTGGEEVPIYARLLFEHFDLDRVADGRALLLLILLEDRELRIEVGSAFAGPEDTAAIEGIIALTLTPALAEDRPAEGIVATVEALAAEVVADPVPAPSPAPDAQGSGGLWLVLGVIGAAIAGIIALIRRNAAKLAATPCPACGRPGLTRLTVTLAEASEKAEGRGERRTTCPHCGHAEVVHFAIPRKERDTGAKTAAADKAGKADKGQGGGASGSW